MKKYIVLLFVLFTSLSAHSQATAGEFDLELTEKRLNILLLYKYGKLNGILPYTNFGADVSLALTKKIFIRTEFAFGRAKALELGLLLATRNQIINVTTAIKDDSRNPHMEFRKPTDETMVQINKHRLRGVRLGYYAINAKSSLFETTDLGYKNTILSKDGVQDVLLKVPGLPAFMYKSVGAYLGWSIYNSMNYTNLAHSHNIASEGRHNNYFCLNFDALFGQSSLDVNKQSARNGFAIEKEVYDYNKTPFGGRIILELGVKNIKQFLSFDANFEIAKYPNQNKITGIVGVGMRISFLDNIMSNEADSFEGF